jgi:ribosomal protein L20A (L18A)
MKTYRAEGSFRQGKTNQEFLMDLVAKDEEEAREKIMSHFGSRNGAKRRDINIATLQTIDPSESSAPAVTSYFRDN